MQALFVRDYDAWLRYHDLPGKEPACVYLHGLATASSADGPSLVTQPAVAGQRFVLIDLLGFGFSDRPEHFAYTLEDHTRSVAALIDHLGLIGSAIVGHSMGGSVAVVLATLRPDLVGRLVVVEGNLEPGPEEGSNAGFSRAVSAQTEEAFLQNGCQEILRQVRPVAPVFAGLMQVAGPHAIYRTAVSLVAKTQPTLREQLVRALMPRVYVFGEHSLQNEDMAQRAAILPTLGVKVLIVPNVDHGMGMMSEDEGPAAFAEVLALALGSDE